MENTARCMTSWREQHTPFYEFVHENFLDWPVTSVQWGPLISSGQQSIHQRLYFSCKTDGTYSPTDGTWNHIPNYIVLASVELPAPNYYFIPEVRSLFNYDAPKKHSNLKVKQIITHPGEVTVIRAAPCNKKILASKDDHNHVYLWTSDKYRINKANNNSSSTPDITLATHYSAKPNYALRFSPSLPRLISGSQNRLELFDLQAAPIRRELGSVLSTQIMKPVLSLLSTSFIEDVAFLKNEICVTGGLDKLVAIWDLRVGSMVQRFSGVHSFDINAVCSVNGLIISGDDEGTLVVRDTRKEDPLFVHKLIHPIHSLQPDPQSQKVIGIGGSSLELYNIDEIISPDSSNQLISPLFVHQGFKGIINQFDWSTEAPHSLVCTSQDGEADPPSQGGFLHVFRPLDIFFQRQNEALPMLQQAYDSLSEEDKRNIDEYSCPKPINSPTNTQQEKCQHNIN